ncbi:MAG: GNAT family N-acetyltransferase [Chloroflexota bacterium]|nr:GNAT family N-acetyltransferase [Chloroflexota bacterium]
MPRRERVVRGGALRIQLAGPGDLTAIDQLWESVARPGTPGKPGTCFVAREERSGEILGTAEYVRTFPPEDGLWAVVVAPRARRRGVGTRLLRALVDAALHDGIRNLGAYIGCDDEPSWRLLSAIGIPVRVYRLRKAAYVEMDLVYLLRLYAAAMAQPNGGHTVAA